MEVLSIWHEHRLCFVVILVIVVLTLLYYNERQRKDECVLAQESFPEKTGLSISEPHVELRKNQCETPRCQTTDDGSCMRNDHVKTQSPHNGPKRIVGYRKKKVGTKNLYANEERFSIQPIILFYSLSGSTESTGAQFLQQMSLSSKNNLRCFLKPQMVDISHIEYDDYFSALPRYDVLEIKTSARIKFFYIVMLPTYNIDTLLDNLLERLQETHYDFRIDTAPLEQILGYAVLGFGDRVGWPGEEKGYCSQAREVDKWLSRLTGGKRAYPLGMVDVSSSDLPERVQDWRRGIENVLEEISSSGTTLQSVATSRDAMDSDGGEEEEGEEGEGDMYQTRNGSQLEVRESRLGSLAAEDLEDLRPSHPDSPHDAASSLAIDFTLYGKRATVQASKIYAKEMVPKSSPTYAALTKQGYSIVGSHSASKTCRWTKSALRGRGSCYKYSFYGIKSHLCMEATPSLSCSNKCVFCWRHGTNPVGTTWRWQVDPPDQVFSGIKEGHYRKIKEMRGVPGVRPERLEEAMTIRHCALSLVGEPIFYPHINSLVSMLHNERISTFLVCNAQHPDQLQALQKVTQLYVSIDASNKSSLRKIDRPLHRDFWERFCRCLDILRERRFSQRTVFRLTLVKGFNIEDEAEGYADLVGRGLPCFVEVKGVTYCGTSASSSVGLTMQNVPFYDEVKEFVEALNTALSKRGLGYGVAAEHAHSCCILLASERFHVNGTWHTSIDYDRFFEKLATGQDFEPEAYMAPTPEFALFGNGGFNPEDERVFRKRKS